MWTGSLGHSGLKAESNLLRANPKTDVSLTNSATDLGITKPTPDPAKGLYFISTMTGKDFLVQMRKTPGYIRKQ